MVTMILIITISSYHQFRVHHRHTYYAYVKAQMHKHRQILQSTLSDYFIIVKLRENIGNLLVIIGWLLSIILSYNICFCYLCSPITIIQTHYRKNMSAWKFNNKKKWVCVYIYICSCKIFFL